jgi:hypothetical protein
MMPCSLVGGYQCCGGTHHLYHQGIFFMLELLHSCWFFLWVGMREYESDVLKQFLELYIKAY